LFTILTVYASHALTLQLVTYAHRKVCFSIHNRIYETTVYHITNLVFNAIQPLHISLYYTSLI